MNFECLMKEFESCYDLRLNVFLPIIIRLDGNNFHSWCKKSSADKPFDSRLIKLMSATAKYLIQNISDCVFAYTQSDEISLLLVSKNKSYKDSWFGGRLEKVVSISASIATCYFNLNNPFENKVPAFFDSRAFVLPESEALNYFIWRQNDAVKNSLFSLARNLYEHEDLVNAKRDKLNQLCFEKGKNWAKLQSSQKRGVAVYRREVMAKSGLKPAVRRRIYEDYETPIFSQKEGATFFKRICTL